MIRLLIKKYLFSVIKVYLIFTATIAYSSNELCKSYFTQPAKLSYIITKNSDPSLPNTISVIFSDGTKLDDIIQTNRGLFEAQAPYEPLYQIYPHSFINLVSLKEKNVLDAGAGNEAWLVRDLRLNDIEAIGVDLYFKPEIKNGPLGKHLIEANFINMPMIHSNSIDIIFATSSLIYFHRTPEKLKQILEEFKRVLNKGGLIRSSNWYDVNDQGQPMLPVLIKVLENIEGLELLRVVPGPVVNIEILKTN
ncbi:MAG: class I SAM-dependent methyltransferase [Bdellovibrionaceae bacterium]|jgi:SAM-dependent methyltransferase|nr:class I SAM-dependent methyltransferase [Pseudobdellovibrionaceae bacterium]